MSDKHLYENKENLQMYGFVKLGFVPIIVALRLVLKK